MIPDKPMKGAIPKYLTLIKIEKTIQFYNRLV